MYIRVARDPQESFERMLSRFKKMIQNSHKLVDAKAKSRFEKKKTRRQVREAALMREYYRRERARKQFY
jgi:ribosomal protein S21